MSFAILIVVFGCNKDKEKAIGEVVTVSTPTDGEIVLSTYTGDYSTPSKILILDKNGSTIFEKEIPVAAVNFRKWQVNGKIRYTYMEYNPSAFKVSLPSIIPTTGVVLNESFQEIKRVKLLPYNGSAIGDTTSIDAHEFIYLDDNHFITLAYYQKPVSNIPASLNPVANCKVVAPIIQEILNDAVVFQWDGTQYPEFYQQSVEGNKFSNANVVHDYIHMNSIFIDPTDNGLICSLRHLNQVIKISRADGHIVWRLGGTNSNFPITASMKFLRQHTVSLTDNNRTLLMFDNGDSTERPFSRVMEYYFNDRESNIDSFKAYVLPQGIFGRYMGSVQKRGETYFIGCGSTPKILEVNYVTNKINFLMNLSSVSYRAFKN